MRCKCFVILINLVNVWHTLVIKLFFRDFMKMISNKIIPSFADITRKMAQEAEVVLIVSIWLLHILILNTEKLAIWTKLINLEIFDAFTETK